MEKLIDYCSDFKNCIFILTYILIGPLVVSIGFISIIDNTIKAWKTKEYKTKIKALYYPLLGFFIIGALIRIFVF